MSGKNPLFSVHSTLTQEREKKREQEEKVEKGDSLIAKFKAKREKELADKQPVLEGGTESIGKYDTADLEPKLSRQSAHQQQIDKRKEIESISGPEEFKEVAQALDELISDDLGIPMIAMGTCRNYVAKLSTALLQNPDYDSLLLTTDVHNIISVLRELNKQDMTEHVHKVEKRVQRKASPKSAKNAKVSEAANKLFADMNPDMFKL
jgi:hypothetical protein